MDGTEYADYGYNKGFNPKSITGTIVNTHDVGYAKYTNIDINFYSLSGKKYIAVTVLDLLPSSSHLYQLELKYSSITQLFQLKYQLGNTNGMSVCIHKLDLSKTEFTSFLDDKDDNVVILGKDTALGKVVFKTTDGYLYNHQIDLSKVYFKISSGSGNGKFYLAPDSVDGVYTLRVVGSSIGGIVFSGYHNWDRIVHEYIILVKPSPVIVKTINAEKNVVKKGVTTSDGSIRLADVTTDSNLAIYFTGSDVNGNVLDYEPTLGGTPTSYPINFLDKNEPWQENLSVRIDISINDKVMKFSPIDIISIIFNYHNYFKLYEITDNLKQIGLYVITITSSGGVTKYSFLKTTGAVNTGVSSVELRSSTNIKIGETVLVKVVLTDGYGNNLDKTRAEEERAKLTATAITGGVELPFTITFNETFNGYDLTSQAIQTTGVYKILIAYNGQLISCTSCAFNVAYSGFDITKCKMNVILDRVIPMSTTSSLQINHKVDLPLFDFHFYDGDGTRPDFVNQLGTNIKATFTGDKLVTINLITEWVGDNNYEILWTFPKSDDLKNLESNNTIIYYLNVVLDGKVSLKYPI
jgi:hypothetical protein